jgi:hypothetical protein
VRDSLFRLVCSPSALDGWGATLLETGELGLIADAGGLEAVTEAARGLGLPAITVVRSEDDAVKQYAADRPLIWAAAAFGDATHRWARERGPMTLLVEADGALTPEDRRRIERFVALLDRQAE